MTDQTLSYVNAADGLHLTLDGEAVPDGDLVEFTAGALAVILARVQADGARQGAKAAQASRSLDIASLPARVTRRKVIRDQQGRIVETVDVEEDAE